MEKKIDKREIQRDRTGSKSVGVQSGVSGIRTYSARTRLKSVYLHIRPRGSLQRVQACPVGDTGCV